MSPAGGIWATAALRVLGKHLARTSKVLRSKLASAAATRPLNGGQLQPVAVRVSGRHQQPVHPSAWLRQQKRAAQHKWYSTTNVNTLVRRYLSNAAARSHPSSTPKFDRSKFVSNTSRAVAQLPGRAPFASTLRPNLTGGALPRTAGGYSLPGGGAGKAGARYFSHTPAAPAQVVQNVSQAMRAFWLSGQRARFDGVGPNGAPRYRVVSKEQDETRRRIASCASSAFVPGSFVDFHISPTVTALSPLGAAALAGITGKAAQAAAADVASLNTEGFLDILSVDFARALKDLAAVMKDLKTLAALGDLPITLLAKESVLRVRFPGVDRETVERLCDDIGVHRGVVNQDPEFDADDGFPVALKFPFAPEESSCQKTMTSPGGSMRSHASGSSSEFEDAFIDEYEENPWLSPSPEGYESMSPPVPASSCRGPRSEYEGLEGIYRFLEECDRAQDRF